MFCEMSEDADSLRALSTLLQAMASALLTRDITGIPDPPFFPAARKRRTRKRTSLPSWAACALERALRESRSRATEPCDAESHLDAIAYWDLDIFLEFSQGSDS